MPLFTATFVLKMHISHGMACGAGDWGLEVCGCGAGAGKISQIHAGVGQV